MRPPASYGARWSRPRNAPRWLKLEQPNATASSKPMAAPSPYSRHANQQRPNSPPHNHLRTTPHPLRRPRRSLMRARHSSPPRHPQGYSTAPAGGGVLLDEMG